MRVGEDIFTAEQRTCYESMCIAFAVYRMVDNKVQTLLVSDGLCELFGTDREALIRHYESDMFGSVHPEDIENLVRIGDRFAREEGLYDVTYRTRLVGRDAYRIIHCTGRYHTVSPGNRVAFLNYMDVTEEKKHEIRNLQEVNTPKVNFFHENMGPLVVISQKDGRLLYYNQPVARIIPPRVNLDSGITFQQFFFPDFPEGIKGLADGVNCGIREVVEPYTNRKIEISVNSSTWDREHAYIIYFYEMETDNHEAASERSLRHRRMAFHNLMFGGKQEGFSFSGRKNQNFRIWNLSKNELVYCEQPVPFLFLESDCKNYDDYILNFIRICHDADDLNFLELCFSKSLLLHFRASYYPKNRILNLLTEQGRIFLSLEWIMMQSPDTGDVFLKVWEEDITSRQITSTMATRAMEQECDFIAYMDILADRCWIIYGRTNEIREKRACIKLSDYTQAAEFICVLGKIMGQKFEHADELIHHIVVSLKTKQIYRRICCLPDGNIKKLQIQPVDFQEDVFYIRSSDITEEYKREKQREQELETAKNLALEANQRLREAVLEERSKIESILMQTVLAVSRAMDAKDPYTCQHSERVAKYAAAMAEKLNWSSKKINEIYYISLVHDIGKMGIPDNLLMKPFSLTTEEYSMLKKHVIIGSNILKDFTAIENMYEGILYHHERYDGHGYLMKLMGEEIPIEARLIAVADAVDAMYSTRPYRKRQNMEFIIHELEAGSGTQFDPCLVKIMLDLIKNGILETNYENTREILV